MRILSFYNTMNMKYTVTRFNEKRTVGHGRERKIQKLMELCSRLPEENQTYIMNLNKSTTTKTIYAYELIRFNDYMREKKIFQENSTGYGAYTSPHCIRHGGCEDGVSEKNGFNREDTAGQKLAKLAEERSILVKQLENGLEEREKVVQELTERLEKMPAGKDRDGTGNGYLKGIYVS